MTVLLGIHSLSKSFGTQTLFEHIFLTFVQGDRVGLLGPNGSGKSTLLKIIVGLEKPDDGHISQKQGLKIGYASQDPEFPAIPVIEVLCHEIPKGDETEIMTRAQILLSKTQFTDFYQDASTISGGWKKRLDIARALMHQPDLLLLDEPTNHLDLEGILWLEKFLLREKLTYIIVSHDRYFLENISNKIVELNRCFPQGVFISEGNMSAYMEHKDAFLHAQTKQEQVLASAVRDEIEWLRRSPKARTTKSRSRIQKAYEMMDELSEVKGRNKKSRVEIDFSASERETRKLMVAKNLGKAMGEKQLFKNIDITLSPGTRLGIVGKNGTGKTTLLKVLGKTIPQDAGTLKYADDLKLIYFDQHREQIPGHLTLREAFSETNDTVNYRGQIIHVNGWAKKFLFSPERLGLPVSCLSGGERARILIARLMLAPADILFLDEPTNDLDIPTLEVFEQSLEEFPGAVVIISHDRCLMDRVCTQILGLGQDNEHEFFADYSQWEAASSQSTSKKEAVSPKSTSSTNSPIISQKKLSYKEQKELEGMESLIMNLEKEVEALQIQLTESENQTDAEKSLDFYNRLAEAQHKLENAFERWQLLLNK